MAPITRRSWTRRRQSGTRSTTSGTTPPWRQPRGKWMVSLVNSHTNATRIGWHLWEINLRFAPGLPPGWTLGHVDPSFRALSGRLKFTVRRHNFNKDSPSTTLKLFFFINLQPLEKRSTTNYAPFALDREPSTSTPNQHPKP